MQTGDRVTVLGVEGVCILRKFHPSAYAPRLGHPGEWDYETPDGRRGSRPADDIFPVTPSRLPRD